MSEPRRDSRPLGAATAFGDLASMFGARIGLSLLSIASVLITTRIFAPSEYGLVAYGGVTAVLLYSVTSGWTATAVSRFGREFFDRSGELRAITWERLTISIPPLVVSIVAVLAIKVAGGFPAGFTWGLTWASIAYGFFLVTSDHVVYALEATGRMKLSALGIVGQQACVVAALVVILVTDRAQTPAAIVAVFAAGAALTTVAFAVVIRRQALWPVTRDRALRRRILRFSIPIIAFSASQYLIRSVDLIVIAAYLGAQAVGQYALAYQAYGVLQQLTIASTTVLTPLFVSLRGSGRESLVAHFFERIVAQLGLLSAVLAGALAPVVAVLIPVVFGDDYGPAADPLVLLLAAMALSFVAALLAPILILHERTREVGIINVVAAIVNVGGDVVLVGVADTGIVGPAIATTAAMAIILVGYARVGRSASGARGRLSPWVLAPAAPGIAAALAIDGPVSIPVGVACTALTAWAVIVATRPFQRDDAVLIQSLDMPRPLKALALRAVALASR
jgi:O-antigen/teichoic acid export membrane protein